MLKRCTFVGRSLHNRSRINLYHPRDLQSTTVRLTVAALLCDSVTPSTFYRRNFSSESAEYMQSWPFSSNTLPYGEKGESIGSSTIDPNCAVTLLRKSDR